MQNSSTPPASSERGKAPSKPRPCQSTQHSFTSFKPLSPDESEGSFSLAKLFQWRRSESSPANVASKPVNIVVAGSASGRSQPGRPGKPTGPNQQRKTPQSSPRIKNKGSIARSWSSPIFQRHQATSPPPGSSLVHGHSKQLPPSYRNLSVLFKRLSVVADYAKGGQLSQAYKESDFKQYWMPDETCKECYECGEKFNTFRRRHHCRLCGQIFCYRCCNVEVPGQLMGYTGGLRVCTYCHKIVLTYTQSPDLIRNLEQLQADLKAVTLETELNISSTGSSNNLALPRVSVYGGLDEDVTFYQQSISRKASISSSGGAYFDKRELNRPLSSMLSTTGRSPFDAFGVCTAEADVLKQDSLRELWHQITLPRTGIELQSHRFRLKTYQNCLVSSDLVDWLVNFDKVSTRMQAVSIGQALLESGWLEPVPQTRDGPFFRDEYALYQPGPLAMKDFPGKMGTKFSIGPVSSDDVSENENNEEDEDAALPQWFKQLSGYESCEELDGSSEKPADVKPAGVMSKAAKFSSHGKLLDLDGTSGTNSEEESELSLKVNLQHFGEGSGLEGKEASSDQSQTVSIITDAPPPPLEQYVYTEGYPISSLRPGNRKSAEVTPLETSTDEVLHGAMMARKIGVDRPGSPQPRLRDDNDERLALELLHNAHFNHISRLLEQLLVDAGLSLEWKGTILPLIDHISERVRPDVRSDDAMDIRQYVKFKKIPGGTRADCQLVSGVVFTKNISHKKMSSTFPNPKILVLCCAIDYQRNENRLASLDPLVLQERNFLKNFVSRVAALRPNVLLVEKTVSRLAQEMLLQHGISLALNVKPEVIERVARCTKADTLRSMEQLSRPRLGTCQIFRVQKFTLKNGETKTLMFLDGCPTELGCTVTLRGGNSFVLTKVKKIIQYMTYIAYNQKLEMAFLMDEFSLPMEPEPVNTRRNGEDNEKTRDDEEKEKNLTGGTLHADDEDKGKSNSAMLNQETNNEDFARTFQEALDKLVLSSSFYVKYPLPYLFTPEGSTCAVRSALPKEIYWSVKLQPENKGRQFAEDDLEDFDLPTPGQRKMSKVVEVLPPHLLTSPKLVINAKDRFVQGTVADFRSQGGRILLKAKNGSGCQRRQSKWQRLELDQMPGASSIAGNKTGDAAYQNRNADDTKGKSDTKRQYSRTSPIHFSRKIDCLDPHLHQRIAVLFSSYSSESNNSPRPCISPWAVFMEFYGRNDITLGGFLERYCFRPSYVCPNPNCDVPMVDHVRYFAHGTGSVYIHMKNLESPIPGFQHTILTWSWCKECKQVTPIVPLSDSAWALSFAKYLELRFYADSYIRRASVDPCGHSLHREHYQYFAFANMVASFKYRAIKLFETAIPSAVVWVKHDQREPSYWVYDVRAMSTRGETVYSSFMERLESLNPEKVGEGQNPDRDSKILQYIAQLKEEHMRFLEQVQVVEKKVTGLQGLQSEHPTDEGDLTHQLDRREQQALEYVVSDSLNGLKRILCEMVENWNNRLQEFIQAEKKRASKPSPVPQRDVAKNADKRFSSSISLAGKSIEAQALAMDDMSPQATVPSPQSPLDQRTSSPYHTISPNAFNATGNSQEASANNTINKEHYFRPIAAKSGSLGRDGSLSPKPSEDDDSLNNVQNSAVTDSKYVTQSVDGLNSSFVLVKSESDGQLERLPASSPVKRTLHCHTPSPKSSLTSSAKSAFVRGHRRVLSSPPLITVSPLWNPSSDTMDCKAIKAARTTMLDRSRSDSDVRSAVAGEQSLLRAESEFSAGFRDSQYDTERTTLPRRAQACKKTASIKALAVEVGDQEGSSGTDGILAVKRKDKVKNIISSFLPGSAFQAVPSTFPSHEHHLLPPGEKVLVVVSEKEPSSIIAYALSTKEYHEHLCEIHRALTRTLRKVNRDHQQLYFHQQQYGDDRQGEAGDAANRPPDLSVGVGNKDSTVESDEEFVNVDVKDLNPSPTSDERFESISSTEHVEFIEGAQENPIPPPDRHGPVQGTTRVESVKFCKDVSTTKVEAKDGSEGTDRVERERDGSSGKSKTGDGIDGIDDRRKDNTNDPSLAEFGFPQRDNGKDSQDFHIKMQFSYTGCRFYSSVYFAEQFRNLRKRIFLEGEERFIRSLAHCVVWRARGGKSGSAFSKSLDDRFVLKQMSRLELQSFLEFAPHYFQYMNKSLNEKRPPLLAKILGVYRIGYRNSLTNATMRQDVVVMENLFYDRKISKTFDLKGSMRSRYVQSSGGENDVLMDENLLELIREHPIFIRAHSKAVLSKAIHNDTEFLAQHMVMDYSLLVGIDETRSELVIGIIDFIRTFTWDKKLEMYVKSSGILGGQGKMPTVVSPELYRTRFTEAMQRYFLMVPDKWTGLGNDLD